MGFQNKKNISLLNCRSFSRKNLLSFTIEMTLPLGMKQCDDFMMFQGALKNMRLIDDKIVYALNTSIPTASFKEKIDPTSKCKELYLQIEETYDLREGAISACISYHQDKISKSKELEDRNTQKQFFMKSVENIIQTFHHKSTKHKLNVLCCYQE